MRVDAHQHFWVYDQHEHAWIDDSMASLRRDFLPNDLKHRLMIGSDWPVCTLAASYTRAIHLVESYLSQHATEVQEATSGGNAQQFWKLGKTRWAKPSWTM